MSEKLQRIVEEIENKRVVILNEDLSIEEFLSVDKNGVTFIEYLLSKKIYLSNDLEDKIKDNAEIGYIYCKCGQSLYSFEFSEETLFSEVDGKLFIQTLIENNKLTSDMLSLIKEHIEIIDILIENDEKYKISFLDSRLVAKLMEKAEDGTYLLEKYYNDKDAISKIVPLINDANKLMDICIKYNDFDLMKYANSDVLMNHYFANSDIFHFLVDVKKIIPDALTNATKKIEFIKYLVENGYYEYLVSAGENNLIKKIDGDKTLLEILIENGYEPRINVYDEKTIKFLYKINRLDLITNVMDSILLTPTKDLIDGIDLNDNKTFLEYMLAKGNNPLSDSYSIYNKDIIDILFKNNRLDLLVKVSVENLLLEVDNGNTYLDCILENIKNKKFIYNILKMRLSSSSANVMAKFYLSLAKHDMMEYINRLREEDLLKKYSGKILLEEMLELDRNLTLNKVLNDGLKSNVNISAFLKAHGFETKNVDVSPVNREFTDDYLKDFQNTLGIGPMLNEGEFLLKKLQELFLSDCISDESLIDGLVSGYRHALIVNYDANIKELRNLVAIKEQNKDKFNYYLHDENSAYFSLSDFSVHCGNAVIETLLHETGHALHYYLSGDKVPDNYHEVIKRVRNDPETLIRLDSYANKLNEISDRITTLVEQKSKDFFETYYNEERIAKIRELLQKSKEGKREDFIKLGIAEESIDVIVNSMFTEEEYISHQKRIFVKENVDAILRSEFGAYISIGDILDAIYLGDLRSHALKNSDGETITGTYGHGIAYYCDTKHGFDEMVANFASISKANDSVEILQLLKSIVGDELYNMLSEFYYMNIVEAKYDGLDERKSLGGR